MIVVSFYDVFNAASNANPGRQEESKLATCCSFDLAPGSCYSVYCIRHMHKGAVLGEYTANRRNEKSPPACCLSRNSRQHYSQECDYLRRLPLGVNTCTIRDLDEATTTKGEEKSCFVTDNMRVRIVATPNIVPVEQLLIIYAYEYWMDSK
jgi:hypothetical protein